MKRWFASLSLLVFLGQADAAALGERLSLESEVLGETREYQVYLPENYGAHPDARFPVLYLLDGDYNFHYVTGLVAQLSTLSQRIPPMIVVGVSDRGPDSYRSNMTEMPQGTELPRFARFLIRELKPAVDDRYRTAPSTVLSGHSIGGLFVLNTLLADPRAFSAYVAISPALWGDDFAFLDRANEMLAAGGAFPGNLYVSLADEKDMGVYSFIGALERHGVSQLDWEFQRYPGENHDSVGLPTLRDALLKHFEGFGMDRARFDALDTTPASLVRVYTDYAARHGFEPLLPRSFARIVGFYASRERFQDLEELVALVEKELPLSYAFIAANAALARHRAGQTEKAASLLAELETRHPNSTEVHEALARLHANSPETARAHAARALELARKQRLPQWRLNQLQANLAQIE